MAMEAKNMLDVILAPHDGTGKAVCSCPEQIIRLATSTLFKGLDHHQSYFPMVSRAVSRSIFAVPPRSLQPIAPLPSQNENSIATLNGGSSEVLILSSHDLPTSQITSRNYPDIQQLLCTSGSGYDTVENAQDSMSDRLPSDASQQTVGIYIQPDSSLSNTLAVPQGQSILSKPKVDNAPPYFNKFIKLNEFRSIKKC